MWLRPTHTHMYIRWSYRMRHVPYRLFSRLFLFAVLWTDFFCCSVAVVAVVTMAAATNVTALVFCCCYFCCWFSLRFYFESMTIQNVQILLFGIIIYLEKKNSFLNNSDENLGDKSSEYYVLLTSQFFSIVRLLYSCFKSVTTSFASR